MGHSLHNRIQTKSTFSAARVQALAMIGGFTCVGAAYLLIELLK